MCVYVLLLFCVVQPALGGSAFTLNVPCDYFAHVRSVEKLLVDAAEFEGAFDRLAEERGALCVA